MFKVKKDIHFYYNSKQEKISAGGEVPRQLLIDKKINIEARIKEGFIQQIIETPQVETENQPEEIIETQYRFEKSGYKQVDGSAFRKNSIYNESEIKDAGLDINTLLQEGAITWLK